jgi:hypothetical protein
MNASSEAYASQQHAVPAFIRFIFSNQLQNPCNRAETLLTRGTDHDTSGTGQETQNI